MLKNITVDGSRTASFSGHRKISPGGQYSLFNSAQVSGEVYGDVIRQKLDAALASLVREGYDTFICGMAIGFDLMAGRAVCDLIDGGEKVSILAAIPFPGQADRFASADRQTYDRIIHHASLVHTVCDSYSRDCFHRRNDFLVHNASTLVCFYNGSPGGTHYTVRKALRTGLRIINLV